MQKSLQQKGPGNPGPLAKWKMKLALDADVEAANVRCCRGEITTGSSTARSAAITYDRTACRVAIIQFEINTRSLARCQANCSSSEAAVALT